MPTKYKQRCSRCKVKYVLITSRNREPICYDCQKPDLKGEISNPEMKKLLDLPEEFYKEDSFLRNIKINYLRYQRLSEKQIEAFKKRVLAMKEEKSGKK